MKKWFKNQCCAVLAIVTCLLQEDCKITREENEDMGKNQWYSIETTEKGKTMLVVDIRYRFHAGRTSTHFPFELYNFEHWCVGDKPV